MKVEIVKYMEVSVTQYYGRKKDFKFSDVNFDLEKDFFKLLKSSLYVIFG